MDRIENHPILGETPKRKKVTFTYDGNDDFKDNEYRGNSIYTINICIDGISCN